MTNMSFVTSCSVFVVRSIINVHNSKGFFRGIASMIEIEWSLEFTSCPFLFVREKC